MKETRISCQGKEVVIGSGHPTVLIGERINPSGRSTMAERLKAGDLSSVCRDAVTQVKHGADILDVNISAFGVDDVDLLPEAVRAIMATVDIPLCLDSTNSDALEAALRVYKGKALINSVTGEESSLARVLPLARQFGAAVIGLVQDDEGIPKNAQQRVSVAHKIIERCAVSGIPPEDIIIDCMAFAIGADDESGLAVVGAIDLVRRELGVNLVLGASNVSFGMPDRSLLTNAFIPIAIAAGATCLIADVVRVWPTVLAADLLLGKDKRARRYSEAYRQRQKPR